MTDIKKKKRGLPQNFDNPYPWVISLGIGNNPDTPSPEAPPASPVTESIDYDYQSANRMADALKAHYDSHHDSMKPEHTSAITSYTIHSSIMNKHLFKKKDAIQSNGDYSDPVQDSRAEEISNAISSSKPFGKKITVYSGMHSTIPPHLIAEHGGIFHIPKFISTSTHPDIAKRFAGKNAEGERHIVKLDIPAYNKTGMFVGHISHKDDEHEYLIDKNQIVHVSHKLSSHVDDKGVTTHVWKGRILTDNEAKSYANSHPFAKAEYDTAMKMKGTKSVFESLVLEKEYEVPNLSKGMDMQRRSLPQIDLNALKKDLAGKYTETTLKTSSLIPTQKHFNFDKVETLIKKRTDKPIVVSKDNKIIDGHHRWIADHAVNGKSKAVVVHKNADELLDYLSKVDYTKSKTLKESEDHPMIDVDGEMKHVNNSEGTPIHHTHEGIRNFHRWFGDSKMVDEHGRPQVFHHGSAKEDIDSFDVEKSGSVQYSDWGKGVYFTPHKSQAIRYKAEAVKKNDKEYNDAYANYEALSKKDGWKDGSPQTSDETFAALNKFRSVGNKLDSTTSGKVYSSYLNLKNPYHQEYSSMNDPYLEKRAKEKGHDGIVVHTYHGGIDEVVAFHDHQIKSSESNNGGFGNNNKINESVDTSEVWYHGTKHDIQFIDSKHFGTGHDENGPGFYMTSSANDASSYAHSGRGYYEGANVMPVHHAIKNPMPLGHVFQRKHIDHMIRNAPNLDDKLSDWDEVTPKNRESVIRRVVDSYHNYQDADSGRNGVNVINSIDKDFYSGGHSGELLKRVNEATGHDGIIIQRTPTVKHAVAWFPHQVKGIYGNKDTSKDGIMENESGE